METANTFNSLDNDHKYNDNIYLRTSKSDNNVRKRGPSMKVSATIRSLDRMNSIDIAYTGSISARMSKKINNQLGILNEGLYEINPCLMGQISAVEKGINNTTDIVKWLVGCLVRSFIDMITFIPLLVLLPYCIYMWKAIYQHKDYKESKRFVLTRFTFIVVVSLSLFYWHFWSFYSLFIADKIWPMDILHVYFMEISFEFIAPRIISIITYNNTEQYILEIYRESTLGRAKIEDIAKTLKYLVPHKNAYKLIDYEYVDYAGLCFRDDNDIEQQKLNGKDLMQYCVEKSDVCSHVCSQIALAGIIVLGIGIIWYGYSFDDYRSFIDLVMFTIFYILQPNGITQ